jgi:hypothetical protein
MMNDNMKLVLKALRSGEYTKTTAELHGARGHCCLGVMCDVYEKQTGIKVRRDPRGYIRGGCLASHPKVQKWVGLQEGLGHSAHADTLAEMNDADGSTFSEIADFIESEPEGLLV